MQCICNGKGYALIDGLARQCPLHAIEAQVERLRRLSHSPRGTRLASFADIFREVARQADKRHLSNSQIEGFRQLAKTLENFTAAAKPTGWVLILGQPGTYKSTLLATIHSQRTDSVYAYAPDLADAMFQSMGQDDPDNLELHALKRAYGGVPVLLMDDLGAEHSNGKSQFIANQLTHVVDMRYRKELPTVITSNLSLGDLHRRYDRLASRIADINLTKVWEIDLPDMRSSN